MPPPGSEDDSLFIVWLMLERRPPQSQCTEDPEASSKGALGLAHSASHVPASSRIFLQVLNALLSVG